MARTPWNFYDYVSTESYDLEINPNEGGSPTYEKTLTNASTSAPDGKVVIFEGRDSVKRVTVSGTILSEDLYNAFVEWYNKRNLIRITDDLGRTFDCYIERFTPTRVRSITHPWRHSFSLEYLIVGGY